jgi:trk system potassium uptake protein TrkH
MNLRNVLHVIAWLLALIAVLMALCGGVSWLCDEPRADCLALLYPAAATLPVALLLGLATRTRRELSRRDGLGIVAFGWLAASLVASVPYILSVDVFPGDPAAAVFEAVSGITTTGATALEDIEAVPRSILLWRAITQYLGGMGVLVLVLAVLPFAGVGGMQLFRAEMPGPSKDRIEPRMASTAKCLWGIYVGLTVLMVVCLRLAGMDAFDAICHSMTAMANGGLSTHSASAAYWNNPAIEAVMAIFMLVAGINFSLHYRILRGDLLAWFRNREAVAFLALFAGASLALAAIVFRAAPAGTTFLHTLRETAFTACSLMTTSGFTTADYDAWPAAAKAILLVLMLMGGCAGSTAGGIKLGRIQVAAAAVLREIRLFMQPQAVLPVRMGGKSLDEAPVLAIFAFLILFFLVMLLGIIVMRPMLPNGATAVSSVVSSMTNTGPGFGGIGPACTYAAIPSAGKLVLCFLMLAGRLELYTLLAIFLPAFWRK